MTYEGVRAAWHPNKHIRVWIEVPVKVRISYFHTEQPSCEVLLAETFQSWQWCTQIDGYVLSLAKETQPDMIGPLERVVPGEVRIGLDAAGASIGQGLEMNQKINELICARIAELLKKRESVGGW